jgi:hypothetical protein
MTTYFEIIFLQGDAAREPLALLDEQGEGAAIDHLARWDFGHESEHSPSFKPWGVCDNVYRQGEYVLSYNTRLEYIGLCRIAGKEARYV